MEAFFFGGGFEILFSFTFFLVFAMIIFNIIRGIREWNHNNHCPQLTVEAMVVTKRNQVTHHHHNEANGMMYTTQSTTYYVTFQVESGDRMEFHVKDREYGMLVEGDFGKLTFQGTRYLGFERGEKKF